MPTLTPAQEEHLKELELQHDVNVFEMLHGKDMNGIAEAYKKMLVSRGEDWTPNLVAEKTNYEQVARIKIHVVDLPDYRQIARGVKVRSRTVRLFLRNESERSIKRDSFLGIDCECTGEDCPEGVELKFVAIEAERRIEPRDELDIEKLQVASNKDEEDLSGVDLEALTCRLTSVTLAGRSILEEPEDIYLSDPPEEEIAEAGKRIQEHEERLQALREREFDLAALVAHFEEVEQQNEEIKHMLESGEKPN